MREEGRIDYVEIPVTDLVKTREFFSELFGWSFQEWGPDYFSFSDGRMDCGLERDRERVKELGATISQDIFDFPGGRRFHFVDPVGTEFAIWSDKE